VDIDRFLAEHQPVWDRLAALTSRARRGAGRLTADELEELVRLYQRASTHLSYARTYFRDPGLVAKLTGLVASAGGIVYGTRPRTWRAVGRFFSETFPAAVWHVRWFVLASALLLVVPGFATGVWLANSDRAIDAAAPASVRESLLEEDFEAYYSSRPAEEFASTVFWNNVQVAVIAFAGGILLCLLTAFILVFNGARVGIYAGIFAAADQSAKFWGLILPHGLLEITAVVIAGAAGLRLGWTVIDPGDRPRAAALAEEGRIAVVIVMGLFFAFLVAAIIEGFVTGRPWPTVIRVGIGVAAFVGFASYLVVQGRAATATAAAHDATFP